MHKVSSAEYGRALLPHLPRGSQRELKRSNNDECQEVRRVYDMLVNAGNDTTECVRES